MRNLDRHHHGQYCSKPDLSNGGSRETLTDEVQGSYRLERASSYLKGGTHQMPWAQSVGPFPNFTVSLFRLPIFSFAATESPDGGPEFSKSS